jgi:hypothetical protein
MPRICLIVVAVAVMSVVEGGGESDGNNEGGRKGGSRRGKQWAGRGCGCAVYFFCLSFFVQIFNTPKKYNPYVHLLYP